MAKEALPGLATLWLFVRRADRPAKTLAERCEFRAAPVRPHRRTAADCRGGLARRPRPTALRFGRPSRRQRDDVDRTAGGLCHARKTAGHDRWRGKSRGDRDDLDPVPPSRTRRCGRRGGPSAAGCGVSIQRWRAWSR